MSREETFGPVAAISRFETEDEAIAIANDDAVRARRVLHDRATWRAPGASARRSSTGSSASTPGFISTEVAPFGGVKESGIGREGSSFGVDDWIELKYLGGGRPGRSGDAMIVEQRDYHVHTGKLPELVRLYAEEGIAIQQEVLGGFVGAFTTDVGALSTYTSLWGYESFARARGAARRAAGPRRLAGSSSRRSSRSSTRSRTASSCRRRSRRSRRNRPWAARGEGRARHGRGAGDRKGDRGRPRGRGRADRRRRPAGGRGAPPRRIPAGSG